MAFGNIKKVEIPAFIKYIEPYAFYATYFDKIEIPENSQLQKIGKCAFRGIRIRHSPSIFFPSHVKIIEKNTFSHSNLETINFHKNSDLEIIESDAFSYSELSKFTIPSKVKELKDGWCSNLMNLDEISIASTNEHFKFLDKDQKIVIQKSKIDNFKYDTLVFACRDIRAVIIPSCITRICSHAFANCVNLQSVIFSDDSNLQIIGSYSFYNTSIQQISIPDTVEEVGEFAFSNCANLEQIFFSKFSQLKSIKRHAFSESNIEEITIPQQVNELEDNVFTNCTSLNTINFQEHSQLKIFESHLFLNSALENLAIPSNLTTFKDNWCEMTNTLNSILISSNNKYLTFLDDNHKIIIGKSDINKDVYDTLIFACRDITSATIPAYIKHICPYAFAQCSMLKSVVFAKESNLQSIGSFAFAETSLTELFIPPHVREIGDFFINGCDRLVKVEFSENSEITFISDTSFKSSSIKNIIIPSSVKEVFYGGFSNCFCLFSVEFLGDDLLIDKICFDSCSVLSFVSFPNANNVFIEDNVFNNTRSDFSIFIRPYSKIIISNTIFFEKI